MKKFKKVFILLNLFLSFFVAFSVKAGDHPLMARLKNTAERGTNAPFAETNVNTLADILGSIIYWFLTLLGAIFLGFIVFAGYLWLTARGNKEQVDKARDIITNAIVGLGIILAGAAISTIIYLAFIS